MKKVVALLALALVGCDGGGGVDGGPSDAGVPKWPAGALSVGTTSASGAEFAAFGATVNLTAGAQGGFHVETRYQVTGQRAAGVLFSHSVRLTDGGTLVSRGTRRFDVGGDGGAVWVSEAFPVFMCPTPVGVSVLNEVVTFEITATDGDGGLLGRGEATTRLNCEAGQYCEVVCKG